MALRTLETLGAVGGKTVLVRCDFNVPLSDGVISDDGRIRASLPTIEHLLKAGAAVVVMSHLGRPDGVVDARYSLAPVATRLAELLTVPVHFATDTVGTVAQEMRAVLTPGEVLVLENLRFDPRETSTVDSERVAFAALLTNGVTAFVSDGFGVVHRKQASVCESAEAVPSVAGLLVASETEVLRQLTTNTQRPYTVVLGGSKVSDKLGVIEHLLPRVDRLLIGGGMAFTFLKAMGYSIGGSLCELDRLDTVTKCLTTAGELGVDIILPTDVVVASGFAADADSVVTRIDAIEGTPFGASGMGLDIGPDTAALFGGLIESSHTVFWNGPMGVFEMPAFADGTRAIAKALTRVDGLSVVGGGDSAAAIRALGFAEASFGHISTGGGASLEFLEGASLPGLEVLGW
ncbi:MAG: phosphoglycerate kinase [Actinomycetota bacterium]